MLKIVEDDYKHSGNDHPDSWRVDEILLTSNNHGYSFQTKDSIDHAKGKNGVEPKKSEEKNVNLNMTFAITSIGSNTFYSALHLQ